MINPVLSSSISQYKTVTLLNQQTGMKDTYVVSNDEFYNFTRSRNQAVKKYNSRVYTTSAVSAAVCGLTGFLLGGNKTSAKLSTATVGALLGALGGMVWGMVIGDNKVKKVENEFIQNNSDKIVGTSDILI